MTDSDPLADSGFSANSGRPSPELLAQYAALTQGCGVADFSSRTQIELRGVDRAKFLHNLCTNDVQRLTPGSGCEAFLLDARGHTLALVDVYCGDESLVIETVPGQAGRLLAHLDRYLIREQVELIDRSASWGELLVAGAGAVAALEILLGYTPPLTIGDTTSTGGCSAGLQVRRTRLTQPGSYLVAAPREQIPLVEQALVAEGAQRCSSAAVEIARVEAGTPWYGVDLSERNLPQELSRDALAISFTKGCYIGQETVARIDALGHVNKHLCGVRLDGAEVPAAGVSLTRESQVVGEITSAVYSPRLGTPLALAYLRRGHGQLGTRLGYAGGEAEVVALPLG